MDKKNSRKTKKDRFEDNEGLLNAMNDELKKVIEIYKRANFTLVVWKDGKVVEVDPNDLDKTA